MNNKIYPEFIEDFKNYVAGIKNLSASYIDSMLSTLKGFLELTFLNAILGIIEYKKLEKKVKELNKCESES